MLMSKSSLSFLGFLKAPGCLFRYCLPINKNNNSNEVMTCVAAGKNFKHELRFQHELELDGFFFSIFEFEKVLEHNRAPFVF
jgi:hypothetical protein